MIEGPPRNVWVWMDVSATCNLSCRDCYTKAAHEPFLLSPDAFGQILSRFRQPNINVKKLHLNWRGEPLINRRLPAMLRQKKHLLNSAPLEFHTHGLLVTRRLADDIVDAVSDKDRIYVSVDGGWPEAHEANRGVGTWAGALRGLSALLDARDQAGRIGPSIGIYEITYERRTLAHPDLIALGRRCDEWTRVGAINANGGEASFSMKEVPARPCFWAGHALCITATGDAYVCLLSFRPDGRLGNVFKDEINAILDRAAAFRAKIEAVGRLNIAHCRNCQKTEGEVDDDEVIRN